MSEQVWFGDKPSLLHHDASILQKFGSDFVDDDLDLNNQPAVSAPYRDVTLHPVVGEAGEGERASGPHVENRAVERLDDPAAECPASIWSQQKSIYWLVLESGQWHDWIQEWSNKAWIKPQWI